MLGQKEHMEPEVDSISYINEFIGSAPNWLLRSGITMIFLVTAVLLGMSCIFKYPDKLTIRGELTSLNPPIEVKAKSSGIVEAIYLEDGDKVSKGDEILYINNTASLPDIKELESFLRKYKNVNSLNKLINLRVPTTLSLGAIQSDYSTLILRIKEVQSLALQRTTNEQIKNIDKEIANIRALSRSVEDEKNIFSEELALIQKDLERSTTLNDEGVISDQEKEATATRMLQYDQKQARMSSSIIQNDIKIEQLEFRKLQLSSERQTAIQQYKFQIAEIINRIETNLLEWKDGFILIAPADGIVKFDSELVINKTIDAQAKVAFIISENINEDKYIAALSPVAGLGKINVDDRVLIKLDGFPFKEFGIIESNLEYISQIPTQVIEGNSFYELRVSLPDTLITTYGKEIPFKPKATAILEVITEDKSVAERIFNQILNILNND